VFSVCMNIVRLPPREGWCKGCNVGLLLDVVMAGRCMYLAELGRKAGINLATKDTGVFDIRLDAIEK